MFLCPISGKPLRSMTNDELVLVNQKIMSGEFFFYPGIQVKKEISQAYITENQTYIYPVENSILLLRKETAVTAKNRTKNPLLRVSKTHVDSFFNEYRLLNKRKTIEIQSKQIKSQPLNNDQLSELKGLLSKSGECFMSAVTHDIDALHHLVFNTDFDHYLHIDFSIERLLAIQGEVRKNTLLVLCDNVSLPFVDGSVDALFSFDYINEYEKSDQNLAYQELKRVLKAEGASVVLYDKDKPLHAKAQLKTDQLSKKAMGFLAPWKKKKVPSIYFHPVRNIEENQDSGQVFTKTSLGRQFS